MMQKFTHYFSALIVLTILAFAYNATMVKWLTPPKVAQVAPAPETEWTADDSLSDLFPDGAWQRGLCKRLQTNDGVLLFQECQQVAEDQWKLWPITVVVGRGMSDAPSKAPVILEAAEGAEIRFAESLDVLSGGAPPMIKRGRMIGVVEIRRPSTDPDQQPLLVRTANVGIDNRKVWTTERIDMRMGKTRMVGRDLTMHLAASAGTDSTGHGAAAVLDRMELIYLDELIIPLERGALWEARTAEHRPPLVASAPRTPQRIAAETLPYVSLQCNGRLEYDFALDQLSLFEDVTLVHDVPGVAQDKFTCESLELRFRDPENRRMDRDGPLDWLNHIHATGTPVICDLPSLDCRIAAEVIDFDAMGGLLRADGPTGVDVRRGAIHARLTQLAYQYDPSRPMSVGTIDTYGAGIVNLKDPEMPVRQVRWRERFKLQPVGASAPKDITTDLVMRVFGDVEARFSDGGSFQADSIEGVLKPIMVASKQPGKPPVRSLRPDRFQATGGVKIDNDAVAAVTDRLVLFFVDQPIAAVGKTSSGKPNNTDRSIRQWVAEPSDSNQPQDPVARPRPSVRGDTIVAKLNLHGGGVHVTDLSVRGAVKLIHSINAGGQTMPAELTGHELLLQDGGGRDVLQLGSRAGQPSRFNLGDGYFVGPLIQVSPSDNLIRIDGSGEFRIPTAVLPKSLSTDQSSRIQWTNAPRCKWNGEMVFDGKTAVLTDGVDITADLVDRGQPWAVHMIGDRLEIVLLDDIQVGEVQSIRSAAIQQVTLLQSPRRPVVVHAQRRGADGVLEARHLLRAPRLTLMPSGGGKLIGAGPGSYRSWMFADNNGPLSSPKDKKTSNGKRSLVGVDLVYLQSMFGDMADQTLSFTRGVRVGVKPVRDWDEPVDAKQMTAISEGESTVDCDVLQIAVVPDNRGSQRITGLQTPWEMKAEGGVLFRTRSERGLLEGTAGRASYSSRKDLFTIVGAPNRGAVIQQTKVNGKPGPELAAHEMTIRPQTLEIEIRKLERLNLGELPSNQKR